MADFCWKRAFPVCSGITVASTSWAPAFASAACRSWYLPSWQQCRRRTHAERGRQGFGSWPLIGCDGIGWVLLQAVLLRGRGESSPLSFTPFTKSHPMGLAPGQLELPGERGLVSAIPLAGYPGEGWPVDTKNPGSTRMVFLENVTQAVWGSVATN